MKVGIHQPNFMPWLGFFKKIYKSDTFVFLDDVKCSKNSYFNRNKFSNSRKFKKSFWLTCPISKKFYRQNLNDVQTSNIFLKKHVNFFKMRYSKTKEKIFLEEILEIYSKYTDCQEINMVEFNIEFINLICKHIEIERNILKASELKISKEYKKQDRVIEIIKRVDCDCYISGNGAKDYQNDLDFKKENIKLNYMKFMVPPEYQIEDENLSIVDLMLHEGICKAKKIILH